jgi:hypothetical protein
MSGPTSSIRTKPRKILIFTDSRGQHKPRGCTHRIFAERLSDHPDFQVDAYLCPMKWTTTLDFLDNFSAQELAKYDHVILYTGIVDWSPRKLTNARDDLYDNKRIENNENFQVNTTNYSKKVINNKRNIFNHIFGEREMESHFGDPFSTIYEGEETINMYGISQAEEKLLPQLMEIPNLIFINSNKFVPGWEGDYKKDRPKNISLTEEYSRLFRDKIGKHRTIDLLAWDPEEVRKYTCDNLHLTEQGSNWIYDRILQMISGDIEAPAEIRKNKSILLIGNGPSTKKLIEFGLQNLPKGLDTFGMGAAYRYFERVGWWPTYHAWCDIKVVHSHKAAFKRIAENDAIPIKKLFVSLPVSASEKLECVPHSSTGDFCFRKSMELGYESIYFIGVEGDYVEEIPESRPLTPKEYSELGFEEAFKIFSQGSKDVAKAEELFRKYLRIITTTPESNPNYFFDDYQQEGDVYSLPRTQTHVNAWEKTATAARNAGVATFNLSHTSKISDFPKISWNAAIEKIRAEIGDRRAITPFGFPIEAPKPLSLKDRQSILKKVELSPGQYLATLIIGLKVTDNDSERHRNLRFLLDWIDAFYGNLFEILIVEQGEESRLDAIRKDFRHYVRHEFLFNPLQYNRGWGYNAAAEHFTQNRVLAFLDTDVLLGANFLDEILNCHLKYSVISPYSTVYFTDESEADMICERFDLSHLNRTDGVKKPTTITGGVAIIRRNTFLELKGFEQYTEYAGEDRSLDVTILNHLPSSELRMAPYTYVHLHHKTGLESRPRSKELFTHLRENYGCRVDPAILPGQDIHLNCKHTNRKQTLQLMLARSRDFGRTDLYEGGRQLTINGLEEAASLESIAPDVIFPPTIKDNTTRDLSKYEEKELTGEIRKGDVELISQFYNAFKGERCFIIGNGPSLNKHDLNLLTGEYTFGVNSFYYKTRETGYRPFFYVVEDTSVMYENIEEIRDYYAPFRFFPAAYRDLLPKSPNTFFFSMDRGFYEKSSPNYAVPRFSTDASKKLYCGQSVTYINLQLAYFMGFTEVYLIGMDFDYVIPEAHQRTGDIILSTTDDPNHFHKDYFGPGKSWKDPKLERVLANYKMAKLAFESVGRKVFNATIGGKLELFDRVSYEKLLRDEQTGKQARPRAAPVIEALGTESLLEREIQKQGEAADNPALNASAFLTRIAGELLLEPESAVGRIAEESTRQEISAAIALLGDRAESVLHYQRVMEFVEERSK